MTVLLYDRRASLKVQPFPGFTGAGQNRQLATPWAEIASQAGFDPIAEGLRLRFTIEKSIEPEPNRAKIEVFNLNPEHRGLPKKDDLVTLQAGYSGDLNVPDPALQLVETQTAFGGFLPIIFKGNLTTSNTVKLGNDWITTLNSGDGATATKNGQIVDLIPKDASITEAVDRLVDKVKKLGVEVMGDFSESVLHWATSQFTQASSSPNSGGTSTGGDDLSKKATALAGKVTNLLTGELDKIGLSHSIQNNVLVVRPKGGADPLPAILLSDETGLIKVAKTEDGIKGQSLIIAGMEPGRKIDVSSPALAPTEAARTSLSPVNLGIYVLTKMTITGDTDGPNWNIDFEALPEGAEIELPGA